MISTFFKFSERCTNFRKEFLAGAVTFATMAYILVLNPSLLSDMGMDFGAALVATIVITVFSSIFMGLFTNYPIAIAPAMAVNGYLAFSIVGSHGRTWEEAMGITCIVGVILFLLNIFKIRSKVVHEVPHTLRHAAAGGIGLFLMFVGLSHVGLIHHEQEGLISLGSLFTREVLFTFLALATIVVLEFFRVKSAFIITILCSWVLSLAFGLIPFKGVVAFPPSLAPSFFKLDLSLIFHLDFLRVLLSVFLVTLLDSNIALYPLLKQANLLNEKGDIENIERALVPDALGTLLGGIIGSGPLAMHLESAAGVRSGGRTGLLPIFVGLFFLLSLFIYPLIETVPKFAPAAILIVLGSFMAKELRTIPWKRPTEFIPALIMVLTMPLTMSIFNAFSYGFISYCFLKLITGKAKEVTLFLWILTLVLAIYQIGGC